MIGKYRKKPVEIEAILLTTETVMDVLGFIYPDMLCVDHSVLDTIRAQEFLTIRTLEGEMKASFGDYIIKGVAGEFYPCKPEIFTETYNVVPNKALYLVLNLDGFDHNISWKIPQNLYDVFQKELDDTIDTLINEDHSAEWYSHGSLMYINTQYELLSLEHMETDHSCEVVRALMNTASSKGYVNLAATLTGYL